MPTTSLPSHLPSGSDLREPTRQEAQQAQAAVRALSAGHLELSQLPDIARQLLSRILDETARGHALSVVPVETALTTTQAAEYLNVSRPYLVRLLREGKLPFHRIGTHRRLRLSDLRAYKERQEEESYAALAELQAQAQELNMGYEAV